MGITGLYALLKKQAPNAIELVPPSKLSGKVMAIDASQTVHKYVRGILGGGNTISTKRGEFTAHIMAIVNKTLFYVRQRILPLYVFDGGSHAHKGDTLDKRRDIREASTSAAAKFKFEDWMTDDVKRVLNFMGIPWVQAKGEADPECARFTRESHKSRKSDKTRKALAYAVVSDDGDMLTYGARRMIRDLDSNSEGVTVITLSRVLSGLGMNMKQFIDLCILMGCDYIPTVKGVGPVGAMRIIKSEPSITKWAKESGQDPKWIKRFLETRDIFTKSPTTDPDTVRAVWKRPDYDGLNKYLKKKGFATPQTKCDALRQSYDGWRRSILNKGKESDDKVSRKSQSSNGSKRKKTYHVEDDTYDVGAVA